MSQHSSQGPRGGLSYFHRIRAAEGVASSSAASGRSRSTADSRDGDAASVGAASSARADTVLSGRGSGSAAVRSNSITALSQSGLGATAMTAATTTRSAAISRMQQSAAKDDLQRRLAAAEDELREVSALLARTAAERDEALADLAQRRYRAADARKHAGDLAATTRALQESHETVARLESRLDLVERELLSERSARQTLQGQLEASEAAARTASSALTTVERELAEAKAAASKAEALATTLTHDVATLRSDHEGRRALLRDLLLTLEAKERQLDVFTAAAAHIEARARGESDFTAGSSGSTVATSLAGSRALQSALQSVTANGAAAYQGTSRRGSSASSVGVAAGLSGATALNTSSQGLHYYHHTAQLHHNHHTATDTLGVPPPQVSDVVESMSALQHHRNRPLAPTWSPTADGGTSDIPVEVTLEF